MKLPSIDRRTAGWLCVCVCVYAVFSPEIIHVLQCIPVGIITCGVVAQFNLAPAFGFPSRRRPLQAAAHELSFTCHGFYLPWRFSYVLLSFFLSPHTSSPSHLYECDAGFVAVCVLHCLCVGIRTLLRQSSLLELFPFYTVLFSLSFFIFVLFFPQSPSQAVRNIILSFKSFIHFFIKRYAAPLPDFLSFSFFSFVLLSLYLRSSLFSF